MTLPQVKAAFRNHKMEEVKLGGSDIDGILRGKYVSMEKPYPALSNPLEFEKG